MPFLHLIYTTIWILLFLKINSIFTRDLTVKRSEWKCDDGWTLIEVPDEEPKCLWISSDVSDYDAAVTNCSLVKQNSTLISIQSEAQDIAVKEFIPEDKKELFLRLGLRQLHYKTFWQNKVEPLYFPDNLDPLYWDWCSYLNSGKWIFRDCDAMTHFICQSKPECKEGKFGSSCSEECHCLRESCTRSTSCLYGCEKGWKGDWCDEVRSFPDITYHCLQSEAEGWYAYVDINTNGVHYSVVKLIGEDQAEHSSDDCGYELSDNQKEGDQISLKIRITELSLLDMELKQCGQIIWRQGLEHIDANRQFAAGELDTFRWRIKLQEFSDILEEYDQEAVITCNFTNADRMSGRLEVNAVHSSSQLSQVHHDAEEVKVSLSLISSETGKRLTQTSPRQMVAIEVKMDTKKSSKIVKKIKPYDCIAYSPDKQMEKQLIDEDGCAAPESPIGEFHEEKHSVQTSWFRMFTFEGHDAVILSCKYHFCLNDSCNVGCYRSFHTKGLLSRKRRERNDEVSQESSRRASQFIRILPNSTTESKPRHLKPPDYYQSSNFEYHMFSSTMLYLNPIACTLLIIVFIIFLVLYVVFLRMVRTSVDNIRLDLDAKRTRDKFLTNGCNCVKDKMVVNP